MAVPHEALTTKSNDSSKRLAELGIDIEPLMQALQMGLVSYFSTSPLAPPTAAGTNFWMSAVTGLRLGFIPHGWSYSNTQNFCTIISPDDRLQIVVAHGTKGTGEFFPSSLPTTQSTKGTQTISAIAINRLIGQLDFFPETIREPKEIKINGKLTYWMLFDVGDFGVKSELSLPASFSEKDRPDGWKERIILPLIEHTPEKLFEDDEQGQDIDFEIKRKR